MASEIEKFFNSEKTIALSLCTILTKKESVYDDLKLEISTTLLNKNLGLFLYSDIELSELEYLIKCLVSSLAAN